MSAASLGRALYWRGYQDYLMPSRLAEYDRLLARAIALGYRVISVAQWAELLEQRGPGADSTVIPPHERVLVARHDVDTDPEFTLKWSEVEANYGVGASYFYRRTTMSPPVIEMVMRRGFHVSYHFEELADVAKRHHLRDVQAVRAHMPEIRELFATNMRRLRDRFGWEARIVCSHGDWINRKLGVRNLALLDDASFRRQIGVDYETYDAALMDPLVGYYTDAQPPAYWREAGSPLAAIEAGRTPLGVLTHPRQWRTSFRCNTAENARRLGEALAFHFFR